MMHQVFSLLIFVAELMSFHLAEGRDFSKDELSPVVYITTGEKISMSYKKGGQTLSQAAGREDRFVMNGQMYRPDYSPVGLYVEDGKTISKLRLVNNPKVNFGVQPQAVFYVNKKGKAGMVDAKKANAASYRWATQIAPMLVIDGTLNPVIRNFKGYGWNRNAIGVKKDGSVVLLFIAAATTLPQLADLMIQQGCHKAAFVDGSVSDYHTPTKQSYRTYGVIIKSK